MRHVRHLFSIASLGLAACSDATAPAAPRTQAPSRPQASISDAVRGGNGGFYFLAPLVAQPKFSGKFDGSQQVRVLVCSLGGSATAAPAESCAGGAELAVSVDAKGQHYHASWKTERNGPFPSGSYYRIRVVNAADEAVEWGHADVFLARTGNESKGIDKNAFVTMVDGGNIPIKFRIEEGATPNGGTGGTGTGGTGEEVPFCVANPNHVDCQAT